MHPSGTETKISACGSLTKRKEMYGGQIFRMDLL